MRKVEWAHTQVIEKLCSPGAISGIALQEFEMWDNAELEKHIRRICIDLDPMGADDVSLLRTVDCRSVPKTPKQQRAYTHVGTHHWIVAGILLNPATCTWRVDKCHVFHNSAS